LHPNQTKEATDSKNHHGTNVAKISSSTHQHAIRRDNRYEACGRTAVGDCCAAMPQSQEHAEIASFGSYISKPASAYLLWPRLPYFHRWEKLLTVNTPSTQHKDGFDSCTR